MKNKSKKKNKDKMTIIKVLSNGGVLNKADLEKWRKIFAENRMTVEEAVKTGEVSATQFSQPDNDEFNYITVVKIGDENYQPTFKDLEAWRNLFEDAKGDPDFKVFISEAAHVEIKSIPVGKIIAVD